MESRWDGDCSLPNFIQATNRAGGKTVRCGSTFVLFALVAASSAAYAQQTTLHLDPAKTTVKFTLGDVLHTVHGSFRLKRGTLQFDAAGGKLTGEIVVDAQSGESGSKIRDGKMHREVLESEQYSEISFRPDRVTGTVNPGAKSAVRVHGIFSIHGVDREIEVPAEAEIAEDHWSATLHFTIPYVKWGMKNPSKLFLRVDDSVEIDVVAAGSLTRP
ncbi:MAG TPA: YceI family protein [Candidatus Sulfotelmatobacter sp.]